LLDTKPDPAFLPPSAARLARPVFWLAAIGILLIVLPFAAGGVIQGFQLNDASIPFLDIVKTQLMVIRITTLGDLLILGANLLFMVGLGRLVVRYYKAQAALAISEAIVERPVAEVKA
jgi:cbb3-type cytochrome oxidase subunit 1